MAAFVPGIMSSVPASDGPLTPAEVAWEVPPDVSHLWGWRLFDAATWGLNADQLHVKFRVKLPGGAFGGEGPEYMYYLEPGYGQRVVEAMRARPAIKNKGPGVALHAMVIGRGNRGYRVKG